MDDIKIMQERCSLIGPISPSSSTSVEAHYGSDRKNTQLYGVLSAYIDTQTITIAKGRFINQEDDDKWSKACVIGSNVSTELFKGSDPIGKEIVCISHGNSVALEVVGVLDEKDRGPGGEDFNNSIYVSLKSLEKRFTGSDVIYNFATKALDVSKTQVAADEVWTVLKQVHPYNYGDFVVDTQEGLLKQVDTVLSMFQLVLGGVGALSLLTGGIGIMNIMLVSVTERTREIGIRKAVGATRANIMFQFMIEAAVVSGFGGLIGLGAGIGMCSLIDALAHKILPTFVPLWVLILGFGFAVGVGLFFGIYPAVRASRLDPIDALRYE
jgi:putative ABC transport system permease protein